jgi:uncharacterized membrane protein
MIVPFGSLYYETGSKIRSVAGIEDSETMQDYKNTWHLQILVPVTLAGTAGKERYCSFAATVGRHAGQYILWIRHKVLWKQVLFRE